MSICTKERCSGCSACFNICPAKAITMREDKLGILLPEISKKKCTQCNLCKMVCPVNNPVPPNAPQHCYAAWAKQQTNNEKSSSGSIAWNLGLAIIKAGGCVWGVSFDDDFSLRYHVADAPEDLSAFCGSKYTQSIVGDSYTQIKQLLTCGKTVLFIGTPCQVAGLRNYLRKDYSTLYTADLICHGMPPGKYLQEYIQRLCPNLCARKTEILFRSQCNYNFSIITDGNVRYNTEASLDPYYFAFIKMLTPRNSCYNCQYATAQRMGDITLGDFWGLQRQSLHHPALPNNISVVFINTPRGTELWNQIENSVISEEREISEAIQGNANLRAPSSPSPRREIFCRAYEQGGFYYALVKSGVVWRVRYLQTRRYIKKILFFLKNRF